MDRSHRSPLRRWATAAALAATLAYSGLGGPGALGGSPAEASATDSAAQARAQAAAIAAQVAKLQPQVDAALAAYDSALDGVAQTVSSSVAARHVYEQMQARADAATAARDARIVALYESGGSAVLYAAVLSSGQPAQLQQLPYLTSVVVHDAAAADTASRIANAAQQTLDADSARVGEQLTDANTVDDKAQALQGLLDQQQDLLAEASARARQLADVQQAAAQLASSEALAAQAADQAAQVVQPQPMPTNYRALYQAAAATCPGLSWSVLAAIGQVETHDGQGAMVSSAGALGPMQFMPATFAAYAVDGDHDGVANIMDPADAVYTAARYLCADGAGAGPQGLANAVWNYNHAAWYVQLVLALAARIS